MAHALVDPATSTHPRQVAFSFLSQLIESASDDSVSGRMVTCESLLSQ